MLNNNEWREFRFEGIVQGVLYEILMNDGERHIATYDGKNMVPNFPKLKVHFISSDIKN